MVTVLLHIFSLLIALIIGLVVFIATNSFFGLVAFFVSAYFGAKKVERQADRHYTRKNLQTQAKTIENLELQRLEAEERELQERIRDIKKRL